MLDQIILQEGDVFFIPLNYFKVRDNIDFSNHSFSKDDEFITARVIDINPAYGIIIEVFKIILKSTESIPYFSKNDRLFKPVCTTTLPFKQNRWQIKQHNNNYDKNRDSDFLHIQFVMGFPPHLQLWEGGKKSVIDETMTVNIEEFDVWRAHHLEERIHEFLNLSNV